MFDHWFSFFVMFYCWSSVYFVRIWSVICVFFFWVLMFDLQCFINLIVNVFLWFLIFSFWFAIFELRFYRPQTKTQNPEILEIRQAHPAFWRTPFVHEELQNNFLFHVNDSSAGIEHLFNGVLYSRSIKTWVSGAGIAWKEGDRKGNWGTASHSCWEGWQPPIVSWI